MHFSVLLYGGSESTLSNLVANRNLWRQAFQMWQKAQFKRKIERNIFYEYWTKKLAIFIGDLKGPLLCINNCQNLRFPIQVYFLQF